MPPRPLSPSVAPVSVTRLVPLALLLPACAGLFDAGEIDETCEDLPMGCGGGDADADTDADSDTDIDTDTDTDTDADTDLVTGLGWSWSASSGDGWAARSWDAGPEALLDQGCSGSLGGPVDWGGSEAWIIDDEGLARVGPSSLRWYEHDLDHGYDLRVVDDTVWIADGTQVLGVSTESGAETDQLDLPDLDVRRILPTDDGLVFLDRSSTKGEVAFWSWTAGGKEVVQLPDVLPSPEYAAGGVFWVDDALHVCSADGRIFAAASLAGGDTTPLASASGTPGGVLACAWDPVLDRYLLLDADDGLIALDPSGQDQLVDPQGDVLLGASFHDDQGAG